MTARHIDLADIAPVSTTTGNAQVLPDNVLSGIFRSWTLLYSGTYRHQRIETGDVSERKLKLGSSNSSFVSQYLTLPEPTEKHIVSCAFKWNNSDGITWGNAGTSRFMGIVAWNSSCTAITNDTSASLTMVSVSPTGIVRVAGVDSAPNTIPYNTYVYLEVEIDPSAGIINVYVNRSLAVTTTVAPFSLDRIGLISNTGSADGATNYFGHYDDLIIVDATGAAPLNARFDDYVSVKRFPLLANTEQNFSPVMAASALLAVNKQTLDGTSYNRSGAANDVGDYFSLDTSVLEGTETILGVAVGGIVRKTDLGARGMDLSIKDTVGNTVNQPVDGLDTTFKGPLTPFIITLQPDGVTAFDIPSLDNLRVGYLAREA